MQGFGNVGSIGARAMADKLDKLAAIQREVVEKSKEIARKALNRQLKDRSDGALYFHHRKVTPNWSNEYIKTVEVGEHVFSMKAGDKASDQTKKMIESFKAMKADEKAVTVVITGTVKDKAIIVDDIKKIEKKAPAKE